MPIRSISSAMRPQAALPQPSRCCGRTHARMSYCLSTRQQRFFQCQAGFEMRPADGGITCLFPHQAVLKRADDMLLKVALPLRLLQESRSARFNRPSLPVNSRASAFLHTLERIRAYCKASTRAAGRYTGVQMTRPCDQPGFMLADARCCGYLRLRDWKVPCTVQR